MNNYNLILVYFLIFIFGASISSFFQLFYYRREKGEDFVFKRSYCESCRKTLKVYDLIPVFSYLFNRGRCRFCGEKIGIDKFILEFISGILSLFFVIKYGISVKTIFVIIEILIILSIGYIDLMSGYIYNVDVLILFFVDFVLKKYLNVGLIGSFKYSLILGFIFLIIHTFTGMMGLGDVIYSFAIGFIINNLYEVLVFVNISFISAAVVSLLLIIFKKKSIKDSISFGPYMSFATIAILFLR